MSKVGGEREGTAGPGTESGLVAPQHGSLDFYMYWVINCGRTLST